MRGPLIFALISGDTGSGRPAVLAIIVSFFVGSFILWRVGIEAVRASKHHWVFSGGRSSDRPEHRLSCGSGVGRKS